MHVCVGLATMLLVVASCAGMRPPVVSHDDSSAFAAVVRRELADKSPPEQVDPRPLRYEQRLIIVTEAARAADAATELAARRSTLRALGVIEGDATLPANCAGSETAAPDPVHRRGCPSVDRKVLAVSLPHAGDATTDSLPAAFSSPRWTVRAVLAEIGPGGVAYFATDYVLEERRGRWSVLKQFFVGVRE
ncbi:MAG TPA: hypothetical protein VM033_05225 [Gemmatimonadaceae bacterium]|nr:hypothetical protein [Gemmatimonadaceae bacterium]